MAKTQGNYKLIEIAITPENYKSIKIAIKQRKLNDGQI